MHTCMAAASTRASPPDGRRGGAAAERLRRCLGRAAPVPAVSAAGAFLRLLPAFLSLGRDGACAIEKLAITSTSTAILAAMEVAKCDLGSQAVSYSHICESLRQLLALPLVHPLVSRSLEFKLSLYRR